MAHYGTLRDYEFTADADDIRGADLYASDGKIGGVKDVVFDHEDGSVRYLVAEVHGRRVLVPASHIFRSTEDEGSFETDLTKQEAANLPQFDDQALASEREWEKHERAHRDFWHKKEDRYEKEYDEKWEEDPVMHQAGSTRLIAPEEEPAATGERIVTGADLTPRRIVDKFAQGPEMVTPSTNLAAPDITLRPSGTAADAERAARGGWGRRSERLQNFQAHLRTRMPELRRTCGICPIDVKKVA